MFCPKCRSEFEPEHTQCIECGTELVDSLPPEPHLEWVDLETVFLAPDEMALMVAKSRLEAEGMDCFTTNNVQDLFGLGRIAGYSLAIGPQALQVRAGDVDKAREILKSVVEPEEDTT